MVKDMYYIYEIPGIKIGCVKQDQWDRRQYAQRDKGQMIILEEHEDIYVASNRELSLQKEKGYKVDKYPYWKFVGLYTPTVEDCRKGGSIGGKKGIQKMTFEQKSRGGKKGGKNQPREVKQSNGKRLAAVINARKVKCPYCDLISQPGAIGKHKKTCKSKP
jgi:hypothetical protein